MRAPVCGGIFHGADWRAVGLLRGGVAAAIVLV